jgi:anaerobic selenocysteine-containing dehydrogenase
MGRAACHGACAAGAKHRVERFEGVLSMNQPDGFDCPGCAWPDPRHTRSFEFCENGAKAVAFELTKRRVTREFFATHSVSVLNEHSDYWLEDQGRLTEPMRYDANPLLPLSHRDPKSKTPAAKSIPVLVRSQCNPIEAVG